MTKQEWQAQHGLTDQDIQRIDYILKLFNGIIINITKQQGEW